LLLSIGGMVPFSFSAVNNFFHSFSYIFAYPAAEATTRRSPALKEQPCLVGPFSKKKEGSAFADPSAGSSSVPATAY